MGGCHINNPCANEIKSNNSSPIIINNSSISQEDPKVSNEEVKIILPVSPSSKVSNNNINKNKQDDKEIIKENVGNLKNEINRLNFFEDNLINNNKNNIENKNYSYENLQIEEIITEEKIHTKNNHEVVFMGNLLLINKTKELEKENIYCVMSRINLKLYKSINSFLKMKKPILIIELKNARNIQITKDSELGLCFSIDKYLFNSENKEQLFKWFVVLNYFSSKLYLNLQNFNEK